MILGCGIIVLSAYCFVVSTRIKFSTILKRGVVLMQIRKIDRADDFEAIANIYSLSWKAAYQGIIPQDYLDALNVSRWATVLENSQHAAFLLLDDSNYIGTSSICAARDEKMKGWGEIISIYLLPEYFGNGYASPLLESSINALKEDGFLNIYLWVLEGNMRARKFYEKHGFYENGDVEQISIGGKSLKEIRYIKHL